jgi:hypothetical protein
MVLLRWFLFVRGLCFELPARRRKTPTHSSMWPLKTNHEEEKIVKIGYFRCSQGGTRLSLVSFSNPIEKPEYSTLGAGKAHKPKQTQGV